MRWCKKKINELLDENPSDLNQLQRSVAKLVQDQPEAIRVLSELPGTMDNLGQLLHMLHSTAFKQRQSHTLDQVCDNADALLRGAPQLLLLPQLLAEGGNLRFSVRGDVVLHPIANLPDIGRWAAPLEDADELSEQFGQLSLATSDADRSDAISTSTSTSSSDAASTSTSTSSSEST